MSRLPWRVGVRYATGGYAGFSQSLGSALVLTLLLATILLGPPIPIGGLYDVRPQDFLLLLVIPPLLVSGGWPRRGGIWNVFGAGPILFMGLIVLVSIFRLLTGDAIGGRYIGFAGRAVEAFVLAMVVADLFRRSGARALPAIRLTIYGSALVSFAWIGWQLLRGTSATLLGSATGAAYGPKLVGEPSVFGAGAFLAFIAAFALAELAADRRSRITAIAIYAACLVGIVVVGSRSSLAACLAFAVATWWTVSSRSRSAGSRILLLIGATALILVYQFWPHIEPERDAELLARLSVTGVEQSLNFRIQSIWADLWSTAIEAPFLGVGPGALGTDTLPLTEAHNVVLRAVLDYGFPGAVVFLGILAYACYRAVVLRGQSDSDEVVLLAHLSVLMLLFAAVAGAVQDSLTPVMASHLTFVSLGLLAGAQSLNLQRSRVHHVAANSGESNS